MQKLIRNSLLTFLISVTPVGGLELALAQSHQQEAAGEAEDQNGEEERAKEDVKHDHSEAFYTKTYTGENISALEKELKEHPTSRGYVRLCDLYYDNNALPRAKIAAEEAVRIDPKNWEGYQSLGACLGDLGKYEEGLKQLKKAINLSYGHPEPYYSSGLIEQNRKRYSSAISFYKKALKIDPEYSPALTSLKNINEKLHIYK